VGICSTEFNGIRGELSFSYREGGGGVARGEGGVKKNGVFWVGTPGGSCKNKEQEPHGVTTQKTPFFIVTAVKTSNLTRRC
jgi:hypothetical protein